MFKAQIPRKPDSVVPSWGPGIYRGFQLQVENKPLLEEHCVKTEYAAREKRQRVATILSR